MSRSDWLSGFHSVEALFERSPERVLECFLLDGRDDERAGRIVGLAAQAGVKVQRVPRKTFDQQCGEDAAHQGVMVRFRPAPALDDHDLSRLVASAREPLLLLFLDGITDPHNLGACLRTADAAGAQAVVTPRDRSAGLTPAVRKVAVGAAETVPFIQVANLARALCAVREQGVWVYGTALEPGANRVFDADLTGHTGLVMGAEGTGLRRLTRESCDGVLYIPMAGKVQSLNVSVATGICLFEARRQRLARQS